MNKFSNENKGFVSFINYNISKTDSLNKVFNQFSKEEKRILESNIFVNFV